MAAAKIEVIRKRQLAQALVDKTGMKLKYALAVVDFVFDEIGSNMAKGVKVNVKDFGIFTKRVSKARIARNPATGEQVKIKASMKAKFTPSKALKEAVISKKYEPHADLSALAAPTAAPAVKTASTTKPAAKPAATTAAKTAAKPAARKPAAKKAPAAATTRKAPAKKTTKR